MKSRKIPMRKDILTNEMHPKKEMVRIVKNKDDEISIDPTGKQSGRGAYVGLNPDEIKKAQKNKKIEKSFGVSVSDDFYQELFDYVEHQRARMDLFGDIGRKH